MEQNIIEKLPKVIHHNQTSYSPAVGVTIFDKWYITYHNISDRTDRLCSVVIDPDISDDAMTLMLPTNHGAMADAKTFDDAVDIICKYIEENKCKIFIK